MTREQLCSIIRNKRSFLCVGLDSDIEKIPDHLMKEPDPIFAFNKAIIDATHNYAAAYKINTAFYESQGLKGWESLEKTLQYIPQDCFTIADAKRGDIGNTATQYAKTFFQTYPFDSITVAPYMGKDSITPFLNFENKWTIVLGLTSNEGSENFQLQQVGGEYLYEKVMKDVASWGSKDNLMFVVGATRTEQLTAIREKFPEHFLLIPGVGTQGGDLITVAKATLNKNAGILINVSRAIIFAGKDEKFAKMAEKVAADYQIQMASLLQQISAK